ncbi:hypothetical protein [Amycolatopsis sp. NPDC004378]
MAFWAAGQKIRADDLNNITPGSEQGEWTISANLAIGTGTLINNWTPWIGSNPATIDGISHSAGVFTVTRGGIYLISLAVRFVSSTTDRYCMITGSGGLTDQWAKSSTPSAAGGLNVSCSVPKRIAAGGTFRCYAFVTTTTNATHESGSDLVTGVTAYRLGP